MDLSKLEALLEECQGAAEIVEKWHALHTNEPIANVLCSFVMYQMALNAEMAKAVEFLNEFGGKTHDCVKCGGPADHWHAGWRTRRETLEPY